MQEFINNLTSTEWFGTFIAFLTANFGVLLTLVISVIRLRIKNIDKDKVINECMKHMDEVVANNIANIITENQEEMVARMDKLEKQVVNKIGATEEERARLIKAQSIELTSKLDALKAEYNIEENKPE
jgi:hypothetical protein